MTQNSSNDAMNISMVGNGHTYGSVAATDTDGVKKHHNLSSSFKALKDASSRVAFLESTRTHHHPDDVESPSLSNQHYQRLNSDSSVSVVEDKNFMSHTNLRKFALDFSLWINVFILVTKAVAYFETHSLSILAALVDSILDVVKQRSSKTRSSAHYPAGASRLEPLGVLSCAALMGFASFGVLKEAIEYLYEGIKKGNGASMMDENWSSF
eukprot:scaffold8697_cov111-Skeletonema_marinoi.AAC.1